MAQTSKGRPGGARPGAGAKPLPPEEKQVHGVTSNFTIGEYKQLLEASSDQKLSQFVRELVVRHLRRRKG